MIERGEYKGKPLIIMKRNEEDKYPLVPLAFIITLRNRCPLMPVNAIEFYSIIPLATATRVYRK